MKNSTNKQENKGFFVDLERLKKVNDAHTLNVFAYTSRYNAIVLSFMAITFAIGLALPNTGFQPFYNGFGIAVVEMIVLGTPSTFISIKAFLKVDKEHHIFKKHSYAHTLMWPYVVFTIAFFMLFFSPFFVDYPFGETGEWLFPLFYLAGFIILLFLNHFFNWFVYARYAISFYKELKNKEKEPVLISETNVKTINEDNLYEDEPLDFECKIDVFDLNNLKKIKDKKVFSTLSNFPIVAFFYSTVIFFFGFLIYLIGSSDVAIVLTFAISLLICTIPICYTGDKYFDRCAHYKVFKKPCYPILLLATYLFLGLVFFILFISLRIFNYSLPGAGDWFFPTVYFISFVVCIVIYQSFINKSYGRFLTKCSQRLGRIENKLKERQHHIDC